jgi:hypothetical protein
MYLESYHVVAVFASFFALTKKSVVLSHNAVILSVGTTDCSLNFNFPKKVQLFSLCAPKHNPSAQAVYFYCKSFKIDRYTQHSDCQLPRTQGSIPCKGRDGRAIAQAVSRRILTAEARLRAQGSPRGFVVDKVAMAQVLLRALRFSPVNIISPLLHIYSCIIWELGNGPVSGRSSTET